ncbi:MAG: tail fiber protein [Thermomicrobiales bacterium]|nr:tail fiber protein [Thermomicrobiales bacterium]
MPYPGEIRLFAGNVAPAGWVFCHGQVANIRALPKLFSAVGARYGGDGRHTFALPDLRGRVPLHRSDTIAVSASGGAEAVTLAGAQIPQHGHGLPVPDSAASSNVAGRALRVSANVGAHQTVKLGKMTSTGLGSAHDNLQPYLALNYMIAADEPDAGPVVGEVRILAGSGVPDGWAKCDGQALNIAKFGDLYSVIGTTYGGDGRTQFALPDLRGRVAMQAGRGPGLSTRKLGEAGGDATIALREDQLPQHDHGAELSVAVAEGERVLLAASGGDNASGTTDAADRVINVATGACGETATHQNLQPYLAVNYIIAVRGRLPEPA